MTERIHERFISRKAVRISARGTHRLALLIFLAACSMATRANAGTITITGTLAVAGPNEAPLFATFEKSDALATSKAIADVANGHLGALVSSLPGGTAGADAVVVLGLTFQDMTADDFLTMNMSLHGTFTPGSGAEADFFVDDGNGVTNAATITCNSFNVQFRGVPCFPANSVQAVVPLDNVDSLFLTWQLVPGIGVASGTADFFNSDDFSITVPNGTIIVNNPGGNLFQAQTQTSPVPEPNSGFLLGSGLVIAMRIGKRRSGWMRSARFSKILSRSSLPSIAESSNGGATMKHTIRVMFLLLIVAGIAAATSVNQGGILNGASYALQLQPNGGIAQGSLFVIFGAELGPGNLVRESGFPLPTTQGLSGTSVQVTVDGTTVTCPMIYTSAGQVAAIMPSNTPVGTGTITVTYNGQASPPQSITVVKSSFGIFAQNQQGSGPAIIQNFVSQAKQPVNTLTHAAHPGQTLILWGTGAGPVTGAEEKGPLPGNLPVDAKVWVGGVQAKVSYIGRSGCCAGVDQVNFVVPNGVTGCYVQVAVQIGNVVSNYGTISISDSGDICSEPNQTMTIQELQAAVARDSLSYACFDLERTCLQPLVVLPGQPSGDQCQDRARAAFGRAKLSAVDLSAFYGTRSVGSCAVYSFGGSATSIPVPYPPANLDAGTISINGPNGLKQLTRAANGQYQGQLGGGVGLNPLPLYLDPGAYNVDNGNGGADVGAFHLNINFPSTLTWTNEDSITNVDRASGVTVTWSGANGSDHIAITGLSFTGDQNSAAIGLFYCTADPAAGSFTVPPYVLLSLPAGPNIGGFPVGQLAVGETGAVQRLQATGLDTGAFSYRITKGKSVNYQ